MNENKPEKPITLCYFGIYRPTAPRDRVYLDGLKKFGVEVVSCVDDSPGFLKFFHLTKKHRELKDGYDVLWAGYLSTLVVPLARLLSKRKIIFNALDSWYDRSILDRGAHSRFSPISWAIWSVDFLAFHLSDLVLVESEQQKLFISKKFLVNRQKLKVVFTGVDETIFHPDPLIKKRERFTVVFRGMFLPATGVEYVIEAAKILKDEQIDFVIVGWGQLLAEVKDLLDKYKLSNVSLVSEFVEPTALRNLILSCHIMLGQFGDHSRLERTIQNKTLEALALGMPYITRDSASSRELLTTNVNCWFVPPANPVGLADAIKHLRGDEALLKRLAEGALATYRSRLVPQISSSILIACLKSLK